MHSFLFQSKSNIYTKMKITKLLSLLLLCLVFLSNGCNEDEQNENLAVEEGCDAPRCYVTKSRTVYESSNLEVETTWEYKTVNGEKLLDKSSSTVDGNAVTEFLYNSNNQNIGYNFYRDGILKDEYRVTFANGKKITTTQTYYSNQEITGQYKNTFQYDSEGKLEKIENYEDEVLTGKSIVQEYNSAGQFTLAYSYDENDNLTSDSKYEYTNCESIINKKYVSDNLIQTIGSIVPIFADCQSGCPAKKITYTDSNNSSNSDGYIHQYNEEGLIISRAYKTAGSISEYTIYYEYECD